MEAAGRVWLRDYEGIDAPAEGRQHGLGHVVVRGEAAGRDTGADGSDHLLWVGAESLLQASDAVGGDIGGSAAPTGMEGGNGVDVGSVKQHRYAVGGVDYQRAAGPVGDEAVTFVRYRA